MDRSTNSRLRLLIGSFRAAVPLENVAASNMELIPLHRRGRPLHEPKGSG